jgi:hypothetical protein
VRPRVQNPVPQKGKKREPGTCGSVILATQKAEIRRIVARSQPRQKVHKTLSRKKTFTKIGLVEWLKVKALSSSPSTAKKKKKEKRKEGGDERREEREEGKNLQNK